MMDKCIHNKGYCEILSDSEVKQMCIEGPCKGETRLLPCPFCGGDAELFIDEPKEWYVSCTNPDCGCEADLPLARTSQEAIEAWNRRV